MNKLLNKNYLKPSSFIKIPFSSVLQKNECETIARNIMVILQRTGNKFRSLDYEEYESERFKDGNFRSNVNMVF